MSENNTKAATEPDVKLFWYSPTDETLMDPPGRIGPLNECEYPLLAEMRAQGRFGEAKRLLAKIRAVPQFPTVDAYLKHYFPAWYEAQAKAEQADGAL